MTTKQLQIFTFFVFLSILIYYVGRPYPVELFFVGLSLYVVLGYRHVVQMGLRLEPDEVVRLMNNTWLQRGCKPHKPSYTYWLMQKSAIRKTTLLLFMVAVTALVALLLMKGFVYAGLFGFFMFIGSFALFAALDYQASERIKSKMAQADALFIQGVYYIEDID